MLEVSELHVSYGAVEAVRGISLQVDPGRVTLILGANGARQDDHVARPVRPASRARRAPLCSTASRSPQWPRTVSFGAGWCWYPKVGGCSHRCRCSRTSPGAYTAPRSHFETNLRRVFELFPILKERRSGAAGLLSGGEQQMLAFGRAMMSEPRIMLMDEPSMGLAPTMVESVLSSVRRIADAGIGVLMVEQNADVGLEVADDVVVVARGEVVFSGPADVTRTHSSVVRAFLGEAALAESPD